MKFYGGFLIGLQGADVLLTRFGLSTGYFHEGNGVGVYLLQLGIWGLVIGKILSLAIVFSLVWALSKWHPNWSRNLLVYSCFLMSIVVIYNGIILLNFLRMN